MTWTLFASTISRNAVVYRKLEIPYRHAATVRWVSGGVLLIAISCLSACQSPSKPSEAQSTDTEPPEFVAINVGGDDSVAPDGTVFATGSSFIQGGNTGLIDHVSATPHPALYRSYRSGNFTLAVPIANGDYDITFHFAEPEETENGKRVFDILVEGETLIPGLDIHFVRGGKIIKALSRTVANVNVSDGHLNVAFNAQAGVPILSGLNVVPHAALDKSDYRLSWADEFEQDGAPDPERWNLVIWDAGKVNGEAQAYTNNEKNARVEDGVLIIEAHKERYRNAEYTSARVTSLDKGDFLHGRVEVRARLPLGGGTWPAIWLYPSDKFRYSENCDTPDGPRWIEGCSAWPNSGEIDIMEHVGNTPGVVHSSIHTKAYYWVNGKHRKGTVQVDVSDGRFHEYAINWTPDRLDVFVDDTKFFTYLREENADWQSWPFDHPYHVILNLAIGGNWGARDGGVDDRQFPQRLEIDYVRVYELLR